MVRETAASMNEVGRFLNELDDQELAEVSEHVDGLDGPDVEDEEVESVEVDSLQDLREAVRKEAHIIVDAEFTCVSERGAIRRDKERHEPIVCQAELEEGFELHIYAERVTPHFDAAAFVMKQETVPIRIEGANHFQMVYPHQETYEIVASDIFLE